MEMDHVAPLHGGIIIRPTEAPEIKSEAGLHVVQPETELKADTRYGEVVKAATGIPVKPGDRLMFDGYRGSEIDIDGESFLVLKEPDVIAVLAG